MRQINDKLIYKWVATLGNYKESTDFRNRINFLPFPGKHPVRVALNCHYSIPRREQDAEPEIRLMTYIGKPTNRVMDIFNRFNALIAAFDDYAVLFDRYGPLYVKSNMRGYWRGVSNYFGLAIFNIGYKTDYKAGAAVIKTGGIKIPVYNSDVFSSPIGKRSMVRNILRINKVLINNRRWRYGRRNPKEVVEE